MPLIADLVKLCSVASTET